MSTLRIIGPKPVAYVVLFRGNAGAAPGVDSVWVDDEDAACKRVASIRELGLDCWYVPALCAPPKAR